ncbi:MAG: MarR family winged helix-turn-helix transcriptional regulator [Allorhizobium sp.]
MAKKDKGDKKNKSLRKKDGRLDATRDLASAVTQAARAMRTRLSHNLSGCGLYAGQDGVVLALSEIDGLTPGALAQKLGVKPPTMTRTIGRMEAQGFVERRTDAADARLTKVWLTETGRTTLDKIAAATAQCDALATRDMSGKDIRTLVKLLSAIDKNLHVPEQEE